MSNSESEVSTYFSGSESDSSGYSSVSDSDAGSKSRHSSRTPKHNEVRVPQKSSKHKSMSLKSASTSTSSKIEKGINRKMGFTDKVCRFGDSSCRNRNLIFLLVSFVAVFFVFFFVFKKMRPKIVLDEKGHISQKKLYLYSFLFGLLGPVMYFSYTVVTMK
jgi:hypothetical protein